MGETLDSRRVLPHQDLQRSLISGAKTLKDREIGTWSAEAECTTGAEISGRPAGRPGESAEAGGACGHGPSRPRRGGLPDPAHLGHLLAESLQARLDELLEEAAQRREMREEGMEGLAIHREHVDARDTSHGG